MHLTRRVAWSHSALFTDRTFRIVSIKAIGLAALSTALGMALVAVVMTQRSSAGAIATVVPAEPASRSGAAPPATVDIPPVPSAARALDPLTCLVDSRWERPGHPVERTTQRVTRMPDRVRLELDGGKKEWLFERNAVDPARASAWLVEHEARRIVAYDDSALRNVLQIRGWADVLMMRFDPRALATLQRAGDAKERFGGTFVHYTAADPAAPGVIEAWWSEALLLPLEWRVREDQTVMTSTVSAVERVVDVATLADPRRRFPTYDVLDEADAADHRH